MLVAHDIKYVFVSKIQNPSTLGGQMAPPEDTTTGGRIPPPGAAAPMAAPPAPPSATKKITQLILDFWQLISALVGIVSVTIAAFTYFATREQVRQQITQLECLTSSNLILTTYPSQVDQLKLQIDLAQRDKQGMAPGSLEATRKQTEIDDFVASKKQKIEAYEEALKQLQRGACSAKVESSPPEKRP